MDMKAYSEAELFERAERESEVIFCTNLPIKIAPKIGEAFEKKYGIKVKTILGLVAVVIARKLYLKNDFCDVINTGVAEVFPDWKERGFLERVDDLPEWTNFPPRYKDEYYVYTGLVSEGMIYNTHLVGPEEAPHSLKDFLKPQWKDRAVVQDPRVVGSLLKFAPWLDQIGYGYAQYFKKLKKNGLLVVRDGGGAAIDAVIAGKRDIAPILGYNRFTVAKREGAPVGWKYPIEGSMIGINPSAIVKKAHHPFAAKLLMNFLMSREGQLVLVNNGMLTGRNDIDYKKIHPAESKSLEESYILDINKITPEDTKKLVEGYVKALNLDYEIVLSGIRFEGVTHAGIPTLGLRRPAGLKR